MFREDLLVRNNEIDFSVVIASLMRAPDVTDMMLWFLHMQIGRHTGSTPPLHSACFFLFNHAVIGSTKAGIELCCFEYVAYKTLSAM